MNTQPRKQIFFLLLYALTTGSMTIVCAASACAQSASVEFALAAGYYSKSQWTESGEIFSELIQKYPDSQESDSARFYLAEVMMQNRQFENALAQFQLFLKKSPTHPHCDRAIFRIGESAYQLERDELAIRMLEGFIEKEPNHELSELALSYLGETRLRRKQPKLAQHAFETALKRYPDGEHSNRCRFGLAKAFQIQGADFEAKRFYRYLITQEELDLAHEARLQMGIMSFGSEDYEVAEEHFQAAVSQCENRSTRSHATYWLARTKIKTHKIDQAVKLFEMIIGNTPEENIPATILFDGSVAASQTGRNDLALIWLEQLRQNNPGDELVPEAMKFAIAIHQKQGNSEKSLELIKHYRQHPDTESVNSQLLETEGRGLFAAKKFREAAELFESLLQNSGNTEKVSTETIANWRYLKGVSHLGLGEYQLAEKELEHLQLNSLSPLLQPLVHIASATAKFGGKKYESAISNYRAYLRIAPAGDSAEQARARLTLCLAETDRWDDVIVAFDDLENKHQESPLVLATADLLAKRAIKNNDKPMAEKWYRFMAESKGDGDAVVQGLLGLAWLNHDLGIKDESQRYFVKIVENHSSSKYWPDSAYRIAENAVANQNLDSARPLLERLLNHKDASDEIVSRTWFLKGQIAATENRWSDVATAMETLIPHCNDQRLISKSKYWLAESLYRQEKYDHALESFEALAPVIAEVEHQLEPWIYLRMAQCFAKKNDWSQVSQFSSDAKKRFPDFIAGYEFDYLIGRSLEDEGKLADSRIAYEHVVHSKQGGDTETAAIAQWRIGETFFHQEDYKHAIQAYHKVDSLFSFPRWRSAALIQAGKCQEHLYRNQHAINLYTQLIDTFPESRHTGEARSRRQRLLKQDPQLSGRMGKQPTGEPVENLR